MTQQRHSQVIYPKELENRYSNKYMYTHMFIAALVTISKRWELPKGPSTDAWTSRMWYIHTMECH